MDDVGAVTPTGPADSLATDRPLTIGMFARRSLLSPKALRLYERMGLLTPDHVDPDTGYRRYRESQLRMARLVAMLRRLDMPLAEVARIVSAPRPRQAEMLSEYWGRVERRVASQRELVTHLLIRLSGDERSLGMYQDVRERDVPEQLVLTEQRHIHADELGGWLSTVMERLAKTAGEYGGMIAPQFVIYHGEVNQDSDGPVEICTPIDLAREGSGVAAMRREPAHREAYVRLRKAQVAYPQILSAFDAVSQWITTRQVASTGAPREVYFTDFQAAGPDDEVCDVAYPIG
jgi:DNA-binding transcriptional MerR regulator